MDLSTKEKLFLLRLVHSIEERHWKGPTEQACVVLLGIAKDFARHVNEGAPDAAFSTWAARHYLSTFAGMAHSVPAEPRGVTLTAAPARVAAVREMVDSVCNALSAFNCDADAASLACLMLAFDAMCRCEPNELGRHALFQECFLRVTGIRIQTQPLGGVSCVN